VSFRLDSGTAADCRAIAEVHVESWQHAYKDILPDTYLASLSVTEREEMWRCMVSGRREQYWSGKRNPGLK
jgi:hypothetical protein